MRYLTILLFATAALVWRDYNASTFIAPGLELITAASLAAVILFRSPIAYLAPVLLIAVSDLLIGNGSIFIWTWASWALIGGVAYLLRRRAAARPFAVGAIFAFISSSAFFLITNFGVWLIGRGTFYAADISGLFASYTAGIPFYRTALIANLIAVPLFAATAALVRRRHLTAEQALCYS